MQFLHSILISKCIIIFVSSLRFQVKWRLLRRHSRETKHEYTRHIASFFKGEGGGGGWRRSWLHNCLKSLISNVKKKKKNQLTTKFSIILLTQKFQNPKLWRWVGSWSVNPSLHGLNSSLYIFTIQCFYKKWKGGGQIYLTLHMNITNLANKNNGNERFQKRGRSYVPVNTTQENHGGIFLKFV